MSDLYKCIVCGNIYFGFGVVAYSRKNMTCLCCRCVTSDIVQSAHSKHMSLFDFLDLIDSDEDPDQIE